MSPVSSPFDGLRVRTSLYGIKKYPHAEEAALVASAAVSKHADRQSSKEPQALSPSKDEALYQACGSTAMLSMSLVRPIQAAAKTRTRLKSVTRSSGCSVCASQTAT